MIVAVKAVGMAGMILATAAAALLSSAMLAVTWFDAIPPVLTSIVAGAGAYLTYRQRKNEIKIELVDHHSTSQDRLINQLQEQLASQTTELQALRYNFDRMYRLVLRFHMGVAKLVWQIEEAGLTPSWDPPTDQEIDALTRNPQSVQRSGRG